MRLLSFTRYGALKKNCYLPVISDDETAALTFLLYAEQDALRLNKFNIYEPVNTVEK